jgi:hypothetical protein
MVGGCRPLIGIPERSCTLKAIAALQSPKFWRISPLKHVLLPRRERRNVSRSLGVDLVEHSRHPTITPTFEVNWQPIKLSVYIHKCLSRKTNEQFALNVLSHFYCLTYYLCQNYPLAKSISTAWEKRHKQLPAKERWPQSSRVVQ